MVQVIQAAQQRPTFLSQLGVGMEQGAQFGLQEGSKIHENARKKQVDELKHKREQQDYDTINALFGKEEADLWKTSSEGGHTKMIYALIEDMQRGGPGKLFKAQALKETGQEKESPFEAPQAQDMALDEEIADNMQNKPKKLPKLQDFDKGKTPAERERTRENRYKINTPLYQEHQNKLQAYEAENDKLNILMDLSPKITTMDKLNINPFTGQLVLPQLASPEAQRFEKTINDFTTMAKDTYGARVTNFDLQQFMSRLPRLANNAEGRKQIIEQMMIINAINQAREWALRDVIEDYGGIRNIDYDIAEDLAYKKSKGQVIKLQKEFSDIGKNLDKQDEIAKNELKKKHLPPGRVLVQSPTGEFFHLPEKQVEGYLKDFPGSMRL